MTTRTYSVPGMSCDHCKASIEGELADRADVDGLLVDLEAKTVRIDGTISVDDARAAIDEAGFDVAGVS